LFVGFDTNVPASTRWSVQIQTGCPPAVLLGGLALAATAAAGVGVSVWMQSAGGGAGLASAAATLALIAGCLWVRWRHDPIGMRLAADAIGHWSLQAGSDWRAVSLSQFWRGPCWTTLALAPIDEPGKAVMLTVWRGAVPAPDWRRLCVLLRSRPVRTARVKRAEAA